MKNNHIAMFFGRWVKYWLQADWDEESDVDSDDGNRNGNKRDGTLEDVKEAAKDKEHSDKASTVGWNEMNAASDYNCLTETCCAQGTDSEGR
jgi:hypothetical protein